MVAKSKEEPKRARKYPHGFQDAVETHETAPSTFFLHTGAERHGLEIGDHAKLCFKAPEGGNPLSTGPERLWLEVTKVIPVGDRGAKRYWGELRNHPACLNIRFGTSFEFEPRHIFQIMKKDEVETID